MAGRSFDDHAEMDRDYVYKMFRNITLLHQVIANPMSNGNADLKFHKYCLKVNKRRCNQRRERFDKGTSDNLEGARDKVERELDDYLAPSCLSICNQMQEMLPRELRDMIYDSIVFPIEMNVTRNNFPSESHPEPDAPDLLGLNHLLKPGFADSVTKSELLSSWYKSTTFIFKDNLGLLENLLGHDFWKLNLPVDQLVKKVAVEIWSFSWRSLQLDSPRKAHAYAQDNTHKTKDMESLFALRPDVHITLKFSSYDYDWVSSLSTKTCRDKHETAQLAVCVAAVYPGAERLIDAGYRVSAKIDHRYREACSVFDVIKSKSTSCACKQNLDSEHADCVTCQESTPCVCRHPYTLRRRCSD